MNQQTIVHRGGPSEPPGSAQEWLICPLRSRKGRLWFIGKCPTHTIAKHLVHWGQGAGPKELGKDMILWCKEGYGTRPPGKCDVPRREEPMLGEVGHPASKPTPWGMSDKSLVRNDTHLLSSCQQHLSSRHLPAPWSVHPL